MSQELKNDSLSVQNNNSTAGTVSHQSFSRCKSEPVRIKPYMDLCETDDDGDDDDDDNKENNKNFDDDVGEFELDNYQSLPPDETDIIKDSNFQSSSETEKLPKSIVNIYDSDINKSELIEGNHISLLNSMAIVPDFIQSSKNYNINRKNHDKLHQDYKYTNNNINDLKLSKQLIINNSSSDLIKIDVNSTVLSSSSSSSSSSSYNQLDNPIQKQSNILSTIETSQLSGSSTIIKSNSNLKNSKYIIKQSSIIPEISNIIHPNQEKRIQITTNYKIESNSSGLDHQSNNNQFQNISNQLATKTPLKHNPPVGSLRPVPSVSNKNIFQTPQNKTTGNYINSSHIQTPATIFSHWSSQNNIINTPLQNKKIIVYNHTPGESLNTKRDSQWYKNSDSSVKKARKPLTETSDYRASIKNLQLHGNTHELNDNQNHEYLKTFPEKLSHASIIDLKENKQPSVRDILSTSQTELKHQLSDNNSEKYFIEPKIISAEYISDNYNIEKKHTKGESLSNKYHVSNTLKHTEYEIDKHQNELKNKLTTNISTTSDHISNTYQSNHQLKRTEYELEKNRNDSKSIITNNISEKQINDKHPVVHESVAVYENINKNSVKDNVKIQVSVPSTTKKSQHGTTITVKNREYMVLGFLGQGMSGNVYRVQDLKSFELRAIKVVDLSRIDKDNAQSCIQEINMLCKLQAPCIVQMYDYEIIDRIIYVVMEMGDTDLSKFIKTIWAEKKLPVTMILYYWTEMLTAVKYIHDHGVIHSDLKPANFLLVRGRLKLIDFGIASTVHGDMTSVIKSVTVGTLNYISPEALMDVDDTSYQNSKYKISYKSDVWSLGCILYSLVFGYTPFQHIRQNWAKIGAITNPSTKISFDLPPNSQPIPSILIDVIKRCLNYNPKERPSVSDLINIPYIPIMSNNNNNNSKPNIPHSTLVKIKQTLDENEWREFIELMDNRVV